MIHDFDWLRAHRYREYLDFQPAPLMSCRRTIPIAQKFHVFRCSPNLRRQLTSRSKLCAIASGRLLRIAKVLVFVGGASCDSGVVAPARGEKDVLDETYWNSARKLDASDFHLTTSSTPQCALRTLMWSTRSSPSVADSSRMLSALSCMSSMYMNQPSRRSPHRSAMK
ncbi:hypothetical protein C8Q74DRAFT_509342 [Fomes fomentarius]|nr:hypothetical protein C8Q74DRAFT_509342 [Fomes fomentarius]